MLRVENALFCADTIFLYFTFRITVIQSEIEENVQEILKNLMENLANLGYDYGFELDARSTTTTTLPPTTLPPRIGKRC